jgi:hypothetical protein
LDPPIPELHDILASLEDDQFWLPCQLFQVQVDTGAHSHRSHEGDHAAMATAGVGPSVDGKFWPAGLRLLDYLRYQRCNAFQSTYIQGQTTAVALRNRPSLGKAVFPISRQCHAIPFRTMNPLVP